MLDTIIITWIKFIAIVGVIFWIFTLITAPIAEKRRKKKRRKIGDQFENKVANQLIKYLSAIPLRNLVIPGKDGTTSEIDILFVNRKGIFVVECKHRESAQVFTTSLVNEWYCKNVTFPIGNPYLQNEQHIKNLDHHLRDCASVRTLLTNNFDRMRYYNIIYGNFSYDVNEYGKMFYGEDCFERLANNHYAFVDVRWKSGVKKLTKAINALPDVLTDEEVAKLTSTLKVYEANEEMREAHAQQFDPLN